MYATYMYLNLEHNGRHSTEVRPAPSANMVVRMEGSLNHTSQRWSSSSNGDTKEEDLSEAHSRLMLSVAQKNGMMVMTR